MARADKLFAAIRANPKGVRFGDARRAARLLGFGHQGGRGSHRVCKRAGEPVRLNFQDRGGYFRPIIRFPDDLFTQAASGHQWKRVWAVTVSGCSQRARQRAARAWSRSARLAKCRLAMLSLVSGHRRSAGCSSGV